MQIEKALIPYFLRVSNVIWQFRIPTLFNFAVIYQQNSGADPAFLIRGGPNSEIFLSDLR